MVVRLTLLLCLCASFTLNSAAVLSGILDLVNDSPTQNPRVAGDENFDWLYGFLDATGKCDPNPCLNNGRCEAHGGTFKCICPVPFKGKRCHTVHDFCKNAKCGHGECVITTKPPFFECKCTPPFQPPTCIRAVPCNPNPCLNGGTCIPGLTRTTVQCDCPAGYTGKFCQVGSPDCYEGNGLTYNGLASETEDGEDCLPWNSHSVLERAADSFTENQEDAMLGEHNYCRNPDGDVKPWCFVKRREALFWSFCKVKQCAGSNSGKAVKPTPVTTGKLPDRPGEPAKPKPSSSTPVEFATCGKPQPTRFTARIYGGKKAVPGAHPWQVSLQVQPQGFSTTFSHICGGTLIRPCWVLTAAHCITNPGAPMRVVLGKVDLLKDDLNTQVVEVEKAIVHEHFRETSVSLHNDLALLKLKAVGGKCTKESMFVKTACLATEKFPDETECTITGWGATPTSSYSRQLLDAQVLLISQQRCSADSAYGGRLDDSMFCAGHMKGGTDACQGDSGGPLVCQKNGTHFLYGVVSWGDSCGRANKPGIYARVTKFNDWINSKIQA
ncbi:hyaluronan-binding protein 2 [Anguilla anguilla]|uniref:hyaluronan-binding protein 2 n=1 Tax=Anguilla anguilla TaxID=7936 RepID=UPI0015A89395|nr:hyaluronan-binding protein 2 [Anguilla anguilla]